MNSIICSYLHSVSLQLCQDKTEIRTQGLKATPKKSDHQNWIQRKKYLYFSWFTLSIYRIQWSKQLLTSSCRKWQPTPVFFPGESHGRRSLVGYSSRGHSRTWLSNFTSWRQSQEHMCKELVMYAVNSLYDLHQVSTVNVYYDNQSSLKRKYVL